MYRAISATVAQIIALNASLPANIGQPSVRASNSLISPVERRVYVVAGDVWRVKEEANDCDFHLEMSARGAGPRADRIIVEIPQEQTTARRALLALLPGDRAIGPDTTINLTRSVPIRVTGYAFFDAHHYSARKVRGNSHGTAYVATLWEIHPVWKVEPVR